MTGMKCQDKRFIVTLKLQSFFALIKSLLPFHLSALSAVDRFVQCICRHSGVYRLLSRNGTLLIWRYVSGPIAIGRNNWLFAGSLRAGQRAAAVMNLVQSARMNGHVTPMPTSRTC